MEIKKMINDSKSVKDLIIGMAFFTSSSILGPLLVFGGIGIFLDSRFNSKPKFLLAGVLIAFIITNFLIFKKVRGVTSWMEEKFPKPKDNKEENSNK